MAVAVNSTPTNVQGDFVTSASGSVTVASGLTNSCLAVAVAGGATPTSVTYNGTALTKTAEFGKTSIWYLVNPPAGTFTLTISGSQTSYLGQPYVLTGVDQTTPVSATNGHSGSFGTNVSDSITLGTGGLGIDMLYLDSGQSTTANGSQTSVISNVTPGGGLNLSSSYMTSGTAMGWTHAQANAFAHSVAAFAAAATSPVLTGSITLDQVDASGSLSSNIALLTGNITLDEVLASGSMGLVPGSVRTNPFSRNNGLHPSGLVNVAVAVLSDDASMGRLAGTTAVSQNADGTISFASAGLPSVGTSVIVITREADGKLGAERYTVS